EALFGIVEGALRDRPHQAAGRDPADFDRAHFRMVADKLTDKVAEARSLSDRLTALVSISRDLSVERDPERLLEMCCRAGCGLLGVSYAAVGIVSGQPPVVERYVVCGSGGVEAA